MKIEVRCRGFVVPPTLREAARHRLRFAVGRFAPRVRRLLVRLEDENGPRGGIDKRCTIEADGNFGSCLVVARADSPLAAVDRAAAMIGRSLARAIERSRAHFALTA